MPTLKFSQFTTLATVSPTTTFLVGYDGTDNKKLQLSAIQLQDLGGQLNASTQLIGTINTGGATSITLGTYITFTGGDLDLSFGQYIRWDGNVGITRNSVNDMELNAGSVLDIVATGAVEMPIGTNAQRPTGVNGMLRFNTDINEFEGYKSNAWYTLPDGNTTNATLSLQATSPYTLTLTDSAGGTVDVSLLPVANAGVISIDGANGVVTLVEGTGIDITTDTNFNTIEIATTVTDTTYTIGTTQATGTSPVVVTLDASGTGTDTSISLEAGNNVTLSETSGNVVIESENDNTTNVDLDLDLETFVLTLTDSDTNTVSTDLSPLTNAGGVTSVNSASGAITIQGNGIANVTTNGNTITVDVPTPPNDNTTYTLSSAQNVNDVDITLDASTGTDTVIKLAAGTGIGLTDNGSNQVTISSTGVAGVTELNGGTGDFNIIGAGGTNQQLDVTTNLTADPRTITLTPPTYTLGFNSPNVQLLADGVEVGTANVSGLDTTYSIGATNQATNNARVTLDASAGADSTIDFVTTGGLQIEATASNQITISSTAVGTVTSVGTSDSTFINLTPDTPITTTGTISASLSATGTPDNTNFLRGDNTWAVPPNDNTTYSLTSSYGASFEFFQIQLIELPSTNAGVGRLYAGDNIDYELIGSDIYIKSTDEFDGTVTSVDTSSGTFVSVTGGTITTTGTISADLSATGTANNTTFLRGDNVWAVPPNDNDNTTYDLLGSVTGGNGVITLDASVGEDDEVTLAAGSNITITSGGANTINIAAEDTTYQLQTGVINDDALIILNPTGTGSNQIVTLEAGTDIDLDVDVTNKIITINSTATATTPNLQEVTTEGAITTNPVIFNNSSHIQIPVGGTGTRPNPADTGDFRYNTSTDRPEVYDTEWKQLGTFTGITGTNTDFKFPLGIAMFQEEDDTTNSQTLLRIKGVSAGYLQNIYLESDNATVVTSKFACDKDGIASLPDITFEARGNDGMLIPVGDNGQRPTEANGIIRYNSQSHQYEGVVNGSWSAFQSGAGTNPSLADVCGEGSVATSLTTAFEVGTSANVILSSTAGSMNLTGSNSLTMTSSGSASLIASSNITLTAGSGTNYVKLTGYGQTPLNKEAGITYKNLVVDSAGNIKERDRGYVSGISNTSVDANSEISLNTIPNVAVNYGVVATAYDTSVDSADVTPYIVVFRGLVDSLPTFKIFNADGTTLQNGTAVGITWAYCIP